MDLLGWIDNAKLLISGKFKYFHYNSNSDSLEILDGHFLNGIDFDINDTPDKVCILKIDEMELKYDETNGQITTRKEVIGSKFILEPFDNISFYLKHLNGYFDEELKLVEKEKAVKVQALWNYEDDKLNYPRAISSSSNEDSEDGDTLLSIEGLQIAPDSQEFQIILDGNCSDYADELEGEFFFSNMNCRFGDKFQLIKVKDRLSLYNPLYGYLGRSTSEDEYERMMYYDEIPDNLAYLEKYDDSGRYLMRCGGGQSNEDDYLYIFWAKSSYGFSRFTKEREEASLLQFVIYYEINKE